VSRNAERRRFNAVQDALPRLKAWKALDTTRNEAVYWDISGMTRMAHRVQKQKSSQFGTGFSTWRFLQLFLVAWALKAGQSAPPQPPPSITQTPKAAARVIIVQSSRAMIFFQPQAPVLEAMVQRGVAALTGKTNAAAWLSLVGTQDVIGIKVYSAPGSHGGTRPAVAAAVARCLLNAGIPPRQIVLWDKKMSDLKAAGYDVLAAELGIRLISAQEAGYDENVFYEKNLIGTPLYGDLEFGRSGPDIGRRSYYSKLVTRELTKIINIAPLLNHNDAGVSGLLYSLAMGSVDNTMRFSKERQLLWEAVAEIYNQRELADHVVLNITDALICQYEGQGRLLLQYSDILNELRFSRDPVALDTLSFDELLRRRAARGYPPLKFTPKICANATELELGVSDLKQINVETIYEPGPPIR